MVFSVIAGLRVNMALPLLKWDSEVQVVKQSGAAFIVLFVAFAVWLIPTGVLLVFPELPGMRTNLMWKMCAGSRKSRVTVFMWI